MLKREASVRRVVVPRTERVPPLILRATANGCRLRSAALLVAGTAGSVTKTKRCESWVTMRRESVVWAAAAAASNHGEQSTLRSASARCRTSRRSGRVPVTPAWASVKIAHRHRPAAQGGIVRVLDGYLMNIPQQMHPAVLMPTFVAGGDPGEVTDHHPCEGLIHHGGKHLRTAPSMREQPDLRGAKGPDIAVVAILATACLVNMHDRTRPDLVGELGHNRRGSLSHRHHALDNSPDTDGQPAQRSDDALDHRHWQPVLIPQQRQQTVQSVAEAALSAHHPANSGGGTQRFPHTGQRRSR